MLPLMAVASSWCDPDVIATITVAVATFLLALFTAAMAYFTRQSVEKADQSLGAMQRSAAATEQAAAATRDQATATADSVRIASEALQREIRPLLLQAASPPEVTGTDRLSARITFRNHGGLALIDPPGARGWGQALGSIRVPPEPAWGSGEILDGKRVVLPNEEVVLAVGSQTIPTAGAAGPATPETFYVCIFYTDQAGGQKTVTFLCLMNRGSWTHGDWRYVGVAFVREGESPIVSGDGWEGFRPMPWDEPLA
jgi:hypothetical protein